MMAEKIERLSKKDASDWERLVWQRYQNRCGNCGSRERLRVVMVVPPEAGGQLIDSNGVLLCRSCEMAADAVKKGKTQSDQRLVNFWVSRRLYEHIHKNIASYKSGAHGFRSMGALVRYLISKYVEDEKRFDDLALYQDDGTDVKVNVWVEKDQYNTFKVLLDKRGMTVTDAIKSLIRMYEEGTEPLIAVKESSAGDA
jgi:hypothetical protein